MPPQDPERVDSRASGCVLLDGGRAHATVFLLKLRKPWREGEAIEVMRGLEGARAVVFNADAIASPSQVLAALDYALRAWRSGRNLARAFHVEVFLFALATDNISRAIELLKPRDDSDRVVVALVAKSQDACERASAAVAEGLRGEREPLARSDGAARHLAEVMGMGEQELAVTYASDYAEAVEKCVLSRMALAFLSR